jgi:hypothetical protein
MWWGRAAGQELVDFFKGQKTQASGRFLELLCGPNGIGLQPPLFYRGVEKVLEKLPD